MFRNLICVLLSFTLVFQSSFALEVNGELKNAVGEKFASDPVTGLVEGRIYYNTTTKTLRVYDGTNWKNKVDTNSTQTLTNKTIDGNNNTLNVLAPTQLEGFVPIANGGTGQDTKAEAYDALSPNASQGDLTYRGVSSNVALPVGANGQVLTVASGYPAWQDSTGGAGSGEKNYITNPSAATAITGWVCVGDLDVVRTTTAADLPRENTTPSGIKITADSNTQSVADYCYFDFNLDDIDLNRKLNVKFATKQTGSYVSNDLAVVVTTQADRTTAVATPVVTNIAAADYDFNGNGFDTASTAALSLVVRATADMATNAGVTISDVVVGPGTIISAAPIGTWQSYTPTGSWSTNTTYSGRWRQVGDTAEYEVSISLAGAPTAATLLVNQPSGHTIDTTKIVDTSRGTLGRAVVYVDAAANTARLLAEVRYENSTSVSVIVMDDASGSDHYQRIINATSPVTFASSDRILVSYQVPIAQFAGSPNYAGQNDVEYASVGGTWDADSSTTVYGPAGSAMGGTLAAAREKTITWLTPPSATDRIQVWASRDQIQWFPINGSALGSGPVVVNASFDSTGTPNSGVSWRNGTSNTTVIRFGRYLAMSNDDSPTYDWPSSQAFWVVTKAKAGAAVGFGHATTTASGLVSTGTQSFAGAKTFTGTTTLTGATTISNNITAQGSGANLVVTLTDQLKLSDSGHNAAAFRIEDTNTSASNILQTIQAAASSSNASTFIGFERGAGVTIGSITQNSTTSVAYNTTSDERLKENFESFDGLSVLQQIDAYKYKWKNGGEIAYGVKAQELYNVFPTAVTVGGDDAKANPWQVDYSKLVPVLIRAIQEQQEAIEELKRRVQ